MKLTNTKITIALFASILLLGLSGCDSKTGTPTDSGLAGGNPPIVEDDFIGKVTDFSDSQMMTDLNVKLVGLDISDGTLKLAIKSNTTFPYIWIANSSEGTISKLDVNTGEELGRYRTGPGTGETHTPSDPSRTTVDQDGNVWVGNRVGNTITKVGLKEWDQCIDRNGNGVIDTSTGATDVKDWNGTFNTDYGIDGAKDECILQHVAMEAEGITTPTNIRLVAITPDNNIFVGGSSQLSLFKVDNKTGAILDATETKKNHYGGVVDKEGNLWSMPSSHDGTVEKISSDMKTSEIISLGACSGYGVTVDKYGKVWTSELGGGKFSAFDPADPVGTLKVFTQMAHSNAQGITTDNDGDVFIAGSLFGGPVGHYKQVFDAAGNFTGVSFVANYTVGSGPTGVAVDSNGLVWSANISSNDASRIDPSTGDVDTFPVGQGPYNYSDMTGNIVRTITKRQGSWEATFDSEIVDYAWVSATWKLAADAPVGTDVKVFVKTANDKISLNAESYVEVQSGVAMQGIKGKYLKLKITLTSSDATSTPVVVEVSVK